jgi:hypothetical protein
MLKQLIDTYYAGDDGMLLLKILHALQDEDYMKAQVLLQSPYVIRNMTSNGGQNILGDYLKQKLIMLMQSLK